MHSAPAIGVGTDGTNTVNDPSSSFSMIGVWTLLFRKFGKAATDRCANQNRHGGHRGPRPGPRNLQSFNSVAGLAASLLIQVPNSLPVRERGGKVRKRRRGRHSAQWLGPSVVKVPDWIESWRGCV